MFSPDTQQKIQKHIEAMPDSLRQEPATEAQLRDFEANFGTIPEDYRWFLRTCGGGYFGSEEWTTLLGYPRAMRSFKTSLAHKDGR